MGQAITTCSPICCRCLSAPLQSIMQMQSPSSSIRGEDDALETADLLDEENYRSALAYSEEHIQVLVDHQMATLADRLAALDSQLLSEDNLDKSHDTLSGNQTTDASSIQHEDEALGSLEEGNGEDLLGSLLDEDSNTAEPLPKLEGLLTEVELGPHDFEKADATLTTTCNSENSAIEDEFRESTLK
uniref:Uncharacterized protein n=1 Tax=Lotharella oceanica TaxID=641309 RepID=A0A7S2TG93_9EUKA|mmetsp:Transcript_10158/g.19496  ORF Transcript_10158/g.19496 Transcript_10158/m.19496 type:complete len:187 (+) Transcript_10158:117-677(+)